MNRRDFLKLTGAVDVAAMVPLPAADAYPHFDPSEEYGQNSWISARAASSTMQLIVKRLEKTVSVVIPPKYRDDITWFYLPGEVGAGDPLGRWGFVGWHYPKMSDEHLRKMRAESLDRGDRKHAGIA